MAIGLDTFPVWICVEGGWGLKQRLSGFIEFEMGIASDCMTQYRKRSMLKREERKEVRVSDRRVIEEGGSV